MTVEPLHKTTELPLEQQPQEATTIRGNKGRKIHRPEKACLPADYIKKMREQFTNKQIAEILGCSDNLISEAIRTGFVSINYELAAKYYYMWQHGQDDQAIVVIRTTKDRLNQLGGMIDPDHFPKIDVIK